MNGEQVVESFSVGLMIGVLFGGEEEDAHDHGDGDGHDHGDDHGPEDEVEDADDDAHGREHSAEPTPVASGDVADLRTGGASFAAEEMRVPGKVVAIDFWAEWCAPCHDIARVLEARAAFDDRLAVRKVEVPTFDSPVATEHLAGVAGLPVVWLVDEQGLVVEKLVQPDLERLSAALDALLAE